MRHKTSTREGQIAPVVDSTDLTPRKMNEIRDIHNPFKAWLDKNRIPFHRNRPDKKTTAIKGDPDFLCTLTNRCIYIECKVPGKKLSPDQVERIAYLRQAGNAVRVAYSVEECILAVETWLGVVNAADEAPEAGLAAPSNFANWYALHGFALGIGRENARLIYDSARGRPSDPERPKSDEAVGVSSENLFLATLHGKDCVFERHGPNAGKLVRTATEADRINLRRR